MASWDRQPKEPKQAYAHFTIHRDTGPQRNLRETSELVGISYLTIQQESARWNWTARCDQFDAHIEQLQRAAYTKELERQARQRAAGHSALFGKALALLAKVDSAKLGEISAAMKVATDAMRLEADLATAKTEIDVRDLTPEQARDELRGLVRGRTAGVDRQPAGRGPAASASADRGGVPAVN